MNLYCISGLAADHKVFANLQWDNRYVIHPIEWIEPIPNESLLSYAQRMATPIDRSKPFVLLGLSFGGVVVQCMNQFLTPKANILLSTIRSAEEIPIWLRLGAACRLYPARLIKYAPWRRRLLSLLFGTKNKHLIQYLRRCIDHRSVYYLRWSMHQIMHCKEVALQAPTLRIHGGKDKLFPITLCRPDVVIPQGSHFMVYTHARLLSEHINHFLHQYYQT